MINHVLTGIRSGIATCWQNMFRNFVIAQGYPVAARSAGEQGLELPLDMMLALGRTPLTTVFDAVTLFKGFHTALVPMLVLGTSVVWHFLVNQDCTRLSYSTAMATAQVHQLLDQCNVESGRHFVGWTPVADVLTGR